MQLLKALNHLFKRLQIVMQLIKNILISWQINSIQQKIKSVHCKSGDVKIFRAKIAELNRKRNK